VRRGDDDSRRRIIDFEQPVIPDDIEASEGAGLPDRGRSRRVRRRHHPPSDPAVASPTPDEGDFPRDTVQGLEDNTLADGLFHAAAWVFLLIGTLAAVNAWQRRRLAPPWRSHIGLLLAGWGVFNLVEGIIDHQILGIHHVRDDLGGPLSWDIGFLVFGALLVLVGSALARSGERAATVGRVGGPTIARHEPHKT
jgi:uncharacterized membrane protein